MPAQPKATLEKILQLLGFPATVEEHPWKTASCST